MNKKILIAIAWPYVNGDIHVGHLAGYLLPADIMARYQRLRGNDVLMVSGSDCHGTPITVEADKRGKTPAEIVEMYHKRDIELFKQYNLSYNLYTTTTTENHKRVVQELFIDLLKNEFITKKKEKQYYSEADQKFLPDRYVEGECPHCHSQEQRSDQCEACGRMLEQGTLINPYSKLTKAEVTLKETEHYYLDLSSLSDDLEKYVEEVGKKNWRDWVYQEAKGWIKEGLRERAITRDLDWGIEIPVEKIREFADANPDRDVLLDNYEGKRIYVWFEAVTGYLSAPQELILRRARHDTSGDVIVDFENIEGDDWKDWWIDDENSPEANKKHYYFLGQDNVVFHTILWQGQLLGAKKDYHLPDVVSANKFMNYAGKKFSKSRNWIIDSAEIADEFGVDAVRYYIAANLPENKEGNFTWESFEAAVNNELVANFGNLVNRTLTFTKKYFDGEISSLNENILEEKVIYERNKLISEISKEMLTANSSATLEKIMKFSSFGNKYFNDNKIWEVIKEDYTQAKKIIFNLLVIIDSLSILIYPFLPDASSKVRRMIGKDVILTSINKDLIGMSLDHQLELDTSSYLVNNIEILFTKIDVSHKIAEAKKSQIELLYKDVKLAKVLEVSQHPNADKLKVTKISDGEDEFTVVTGATNMKEGDIVAYLGVGGLVPGPFLQKKKKIQLEEKDLRGVVSYGMILAEDELGFGKGHDEVVIYDIDENLVGESILGQIDSEMMDNLVENIR